MTAKGHVLLALPFAIVTASNIGLSGPRLAAFITIVLFASLFPDIDENRSFIGKRFWFMSWSIKFIALFIPAFKHRGVTHFFIVPATIIIVGILFDNIWISGFGMGWLLHTVGDLITVGGIRGYLYPLWPDAKIKIMPEFIPIYTGGLLEHVIIAWLSILNIMLCIPMVI